MTSRTLSVLAIVLLIGCGSDGATTEFDEDTGGLQPGDTATAVDSTAPTDTTTSGETTPPADTTTPPTDTPVDTPATTTSMKCGTFSCAIATQDCCVIGGIGACLMKGATCAGARWSCTSKTNCGSGEVCCVSGAGTGGGSCAPAASCPSTHTCDTAAECTGSMKTCTDIGAGIKACSK